MNAALVGTASVRTTVAVVMALALAPWLACSCDGNPFTASDGFSPLWRYPSIGLFQGNPGADNEVVLIAVRDSVIALDQFTGEARWKLVFTGGAFFYGLNPP